MEIEKSIVVVGQHTDQAVIEFADGVETDANGAANILINESVDVVVRPVGDAKMTCVRLFGGNDLWGHDWPDEEDGRYCRGFGFGEPGTYKIFAMVSFTDVDMEHWDWSQGEPPFEWVTTNELTVNATQLGEVGEFRIESVSPSVVTQGEPVEVVITASENATNYNFDVHDDIDEDNDNFRRYDWDWGWKDDWKDGKRTVTITTAGMPGGNYFVNAWADAPEARATRATTPATPPITRNRAL